MFSPGPASPKPISSGTPSTAFHTGVTRGFESLDLSLVCEKGIIWGKEKSTDVASKTGWRGLTGWKEKTLPIFLYSFI